MKTAAALLALALAIALGAPCARAQDPAPPRRRPEARLDLGATFHDNFLQAPSGDAQLDPWAYAAGGELAWLLGKDRKTRLSLLPEVRRYEVFGTSPSLAVRLRRTFQAHGVTLRAGHAWHRPGGDDEDLQPTDALSLEGGYDVRFARRWQASFGAQWTADAGDDDASGATSRAVEAALRYRPKGRRVPSPEIGMLLGSRDPDRDEAAYDQRDVTLKLTWAPVPKSYLSVGWRERHRDFRTGDPASSYFLREDDRRGLSLGGRYDMKGRTSWNAYLAREDASSTDPGREYVSHVVSAWWSVDL